MEANVNHNKMACGDSYSCDVSSKGLESRVGSY